MLTIDLYGRFSSAFGYVPGNMRTRTQQPPSGVEVYVADATFADLKIKSAHDGRVYNFQNTVFTEDDSGIFAPPPMLKFERSKNITATAVAGSDNVVVEDFGLKPWDITWDGLLIDMDHHQYPTEKMQAFRRLFETTNIFDVLKCQPMLDLGITALYFEKVSELSVLEAYPDTVKYKLTAHSTQPPEFTIND